MAAANKENYESVECKCCNDHDAIDIKHVHRLYDAIAKAKDAFRQRNVCDVHIQSE